MVYTHSEKVNRKEGKIMVDKLKTYYKRAIVVAIAMKIFDVIFPGPVKEFLFYAIVGLCCIMSVILFFVILYGISKSEI